MIPGLWLARLRLCMCIVGLLLGGSSSSLHRYYIDAWYQNICRESFLFMFLRNDRCAAVVDWLCGNSGKRKWSINSEILAVRLKHQLMIGRPTKLPG